VKIYGGEDNSCAFAYENPIPCLRMMGWKKAREYTLDAATKYWIQLTAVSSQHVSQKEQY
jgi:hypothetical protein